MQKAARLSYIDMAKGFAMLLVIIGHCTYSDKELVGWLYSFHMPLFFALSGFTFRPEKYNSLGKVIKAKFRQLVIPYFFFSVVLWALCLLLLDGMKLQYRHINELIGIVVSDRLSDYFFSLWFLTTLFLSEPLLWCLTRITKGRALWLAPISVAAFAVGTVAIDFFKGTYWSADLVPIALSFLMFGYLLRKKLDSSSDRQPSALLIAAAWGVNLLFFWLNYRLGGRSDLYFCKLVNPLYFYLSACGGTVGAILLCRRLARCAALEYIGRYSLVFYAFESLAIPLSERFLRAVLGAAALERTPLPATALVLLMSCAMLAMASVVYGAIRRSSKPQPVYIG